MRDYFGRELSQGDLVRYLDNNRLGEVQAVDDAEGVVLVRIIDYDFLVAGWSIIAHGTKFKLTQRTPRRSGSRPSSRTQSRRGDDK